jgi:predicted PurR-regulated permease PerM
LIKPFLGSLISAIVISYLLHPFYKKINSKVKNENLTIFLIVLIIIFLVLIPLSLIIFTLIDDMIWFLNFLRTFKLESMPYLTPEMILIIRNYIISFSENLTSSLLSILSRVGRILDKVFDMVIFLFATVLFLKKGPELIKKFRITIPLEKDKKEALIEEFSSVTKGMLRSIIFAALLNGGMGALIFMLFGIPNFLLWGFLIAILSFIPFVGNIPVWIGGMLYLILSGQYIIGLLLMVLGILVNHVENLLAVKIMGNTSHINSFLILIGIVSGVKVFGSIGIIMGPLILSLLITLIRFHTKNYQKQFKL